MAVADDFMLLAVDNDGTGRIGPLPLSCGLAAALLVGLAQAARIEVGGEVVVVRDASPMGLADEDHVLSRIAADSPHDLEWWINHLRLDMPERMLARLTARGVVAQEQRRRFGLFRVVQHRVVDETPGRELRRKLEALLNGERADRSSTALLVLAHATGLDLVLFPSLAPEDVERLVEDLRSDPLGEALVALIARVNAGLTAAVTAATA